MPDVVDISPDRFAPLIAPVIERLTLAVVTRAMARGASTTAPTAVPPGAMRMFGQLRTALLARNVPRPASPPSAATGTPAIFAVISEACTQQG